MYYSQASSRPPATHGHAYAEEHTYMHPPIYIHIHTYKYIIIQKAYPPL